jgi:hypothetical protein
MKTAIPIGILLSVVFAGCASNSWDQQRHSVAGGPIGAMKHDKSDCTNESHQKNIVVKDVNDVSVLLRPDLLCLDLSEKTDVTWTISPKSPDYTFTSAGIKFIDIIVSCAPVPSTGSRTITCDVRDVPKGTYKYAVEIQRTGGKVLTIDPIMVND